MRELSQESIVAFMNSIEPLARMRAHIRTAYYMIDYALIEPDFCSQHVAKLFFKWLSPEAEAMDTYLASRLDEAFAKFMAEHK